MVNKALWMIAISLVIALVAAMVAPYFIPDFYFKHRLIAKIENMTGRELEIDGTTRIKIFPFTGMYLENVTFANPPGYEDEFPLVKLKAIDVDLELLPLLRGHIVLKKMVLEEPNIYLHVNKDGVQNWLFDRVLSEPPQSPEAPIAQKPMPITAGLLFSDIQIKNGDITYINESTNMRWDTKNLNLTVTLAGMDSPLHLSADAEWNGQEIEAKGSINTLNNLTVGERTTVEATFTSDLFTAKTSGAVENGLYTGKMEMNSPSLKAVYNWIAPHFKPLETPSDLPATLSSDMACSLLTYNFTNINLSLDQMKAKGMLNFVRGQDVSKVDLDLATTVLDLNLLLPQDFLNPASPAPATETQAIAASSGGWSDQPIDFSPLHAYVGSINVRADTLIFRNARTGKTLLRAKLQRSRLSSDMIDTELYEGKGNAVFNVDASTTPPVLEVHLTLKGVQAHPFLSDTANIQRLSGKLNFNSHFNSQGSSQEEIVENLQGSGKLSLDSGSFTGIDLGNMIRNVPTAFNKELDNTQKTDFTAASGSFSVAQGVLDNRDLLLKTSTMSVSGQGKINLPAQTVHYRLTPKTVQQATDGTDKTGIAVPVIVEGKLDNPSFRPDVGSVVQEAIKDPEKFKEELKNTRGSLKEQLKDPKEAVKNIKGLLQGL